MTNKVPVTRNSDWWTDIFEPFRSFGCRVQDFFSPTVEAGASDDSFEITVELPGVKEKDVDITLDNNMLTIKGEKHSKKEEKDETRYFSERTYGSFQRTFRLPAEVKADEIKAHFEDGVLHIKIPKLKASSGKATKIPIGKKS
jgi:HSP20 family protein